MSDLMETKENKKQYGLLAQFKSSGPVQGSPVETHLKVPRVALSTSQNCVPNGPTTSVLIVSIGKFVSSGPLPPSWQLKQKSFIVPVQARVWLDGSAIGVSAEAL